MSETRRGPEGVEVSKVEVPKGVEVNQGVLADKLDEDPPKGMSKRTKLVLTVTGVVIMTGVIGEEAYRRAELNGRKIADSLQNRLSSAQNRLSARTQELETAKKKLAGLEQQRDNVLKGQTRPAKKIQTRAEVTKPPVETTAQEALPVVTTTQEVIPEKPAVEVIPEKAPVETKAPVEVIPETTKTPEVKQKEQIEQEFSLYVRHVEAFFAELSLVSKGRREMLYHGWGANDKTSTWLINPQDKRLLPSLKKMSKDCDQERKNLAKEIKLNYKPGKELNQADIRMDELLKALKKNPARINDGDYDMPGSPFFGPLWVAIDDLSNELDSLRALLVERR